MEQRDSRDLDGTRIAVVGATGALGSLLSAELAARGARLLVTGRDPDRLEALEAEARVVADLGDATAGDAVAAAAREHLGGLDGLVNAAGVVAEQPLPRMAAYSASNAALSAAATALRTELRRSRVAVYDVRPPHTETGLAARPLAGEAPRLPAGREPAAVARRVVEALEAGEQDLGPEAFA